MVCNILLIEKKNIYILLKPLIIVYVKEYITTKQKSIMTDSDIITIIGTYNLCVRRLPFEVVNLTKYKEGDENIKRVDSNGKEIIYKSKEVVTQIRYGEEIKLLKTIKTVKNGGSWLVTEANNTDSMVLFGGVKRNNNNTFYGETLKEAIELYMVKHGIILDC